MFFRFIRKAVPAFYKAVKIVTVILKAAYHIGLILKNKEGTAQPA